MLSKFLVNSSKSFTKSQIRFSSSSKGFFVERATSCDSAKILNFLDENFLKNEPLAKVLIRGDHPEITRKVYKESVDQGLSVVARRIDGEKEIIGINLNGRSHKNSGDDLMKTAKEISDPGYRKFLETIAIIEMESNACKKLNIVEIFGIKFLSVSKEFWGKGVSVRLLQKSIDVALEENFKFGKVNCVNENCKKFSEQFGLTKAWSMPYSNILCRGDILPRGFPEPPHNIAYVYYAEMNKFAKSEN